MSPNPANAFTTITVKAPKKEQVVLKFPDLQTGEVTYLHIGSEHGSVSYSYVIKVYNLLTGANIYTENFDLEANLPLQMNSPFGTISSTGEKKIRFNTANYPNGIYIVNIRSLRENASISRKLIINH